VGLTEEKTTHLFFNYAQETWIIE